MKGLRFGEALQALPLLVPAAATDDTAKVTSFVDMSMNHWYTFIAQFGAISVTDTGLITIAVYGSTTGADSDSNTVAIPFSYRISNAVGAAPSMGTITAGSTSGSSVASTDVASALLMVSVDPSVENGEYRYVRLSIDPAADTTAWTVGVIGVGEPRYPGNSIPSLFTAT